MKLLYSLSVLLFLLIPSYRGQSIKTKPADDNEGLEKILLLSDLQALEAKAEKLEKPLALALAKAEIADAAWPLDKIWAMQLLREAYERTFPEEEEQIKQRDWQAGAVPPMPTGNDRARNDVRNRVLAVAGRDKVFADQLAQLGAKQLGKYEEHFRYASLADKAIGEGDRETASKYILQSLEADPTQITAGFVILKLAAQDRLAADRVIIEYIERLRSFPLSTSNQSALRTYFILSGLIFPSPTGASAPQQIPPAGPDAIKAYVNYVIESISRMEQNEPGSAQRLRGFLLGVWLPLKQYAPELTGAFMQLERLSRRPSDSSSLPTQESSREAAQGNYEKRLKDALNSDQPDELMIDFAIGHGDFAKARKLIDKLPEGAQKAQLTDKVNTQEALSLVTAGDLLGAQRLAEQLTRAPSIQQVYPVLIGKCGATKDAACASALVYQAVKQLKRAETTPPTPPAGIPAAAFVTSRELDPVVVSLAKLAQAVLPLNEALAFEVLDEAVQAANKSEMDTGQGRTGFAADGFKQFARKNEARTRQAAETFKDPLRQIVALAAIYQWQATALMKQEALKPTAAGARKP